MSTTSTQSTATAPRRGSAIVVLVVAVACVALACRLGFWQLDRAHQKLALQASIDSRGGLPPIGAAALATTPAAADAQRDRRVVVSGHWVADRTIFLDNRQMDSKVGFYVVTPFLIEGSNAAVLVQRGWVARHFENRTALPAVATPQTLVRIEGSVAASPSRLFEFAGAASGAIRQNLDIADFARETGLSLLPLSIRQHDSAASSGDGLERHWPPPATDVQMHYGYAFQWFAIGTVIAFLYVWFRIVRPRQRRQP